jgi:hypothetical protein
MDISGKVLQMLPLQTGQGKNGTWKKQDFILETADTYPKKVCIAVWGDKIDMNGVKPGAQVTVSFDVESREYNGRWYTDVKAWKIAAGANAGGNASAAEPVQTFHNDPNGAADDDLPF